MSGFKVKLGIILMGCWSLFLVGCTNGSDQQVDPVEEQTQEVSGENNSYASVGAHVFVVQELLEEHGVKMAHLIPIDETGVPLESASPVMMGGLDEVSIGIEDEHG